MKDNDNELKCDFEVDNKSLKMLYYKCPQFMVKALIYFNFEKKITQIREIIVELYR